MSRRLVGSVTAALVVTVSGGALLIGNARADRRPGSATNGSRAAARQTAHVTKKDLAETQDELKAVRDAYKMTPVGFLESMRPGLEVREDSDKHYPRYVVTSDNGTLLASSHVQAGFPSVSWRPS